MLAYLKNAVKRWADWVGDRDLELALRSYLTEQGFYGDSATFKSVKLVAIERPGWVQIYTFSVRVRSRVNEDLPAEQFFGLVRQDERREKVEPRVFTNSIERESQLDEWSDGLIRLRRR